MTGTHDIVLLQYNSAGSLLWTTQTGTSGNDQGRAVSASVDGKYIYVTGISDGSLNGQPYAGGDCILVDCNFILMIFFGTTANTADLCSVFLCVVL